MACLIDTNLCRLRGDTTTIAIRLTTDGTTPIDITGNTFLLTIDPSQTPIDNSNNVLQLTGVIINAADGRVGFTPTTPQANIAPGVYFYDIQWTAGATIRTIMRGQFEVQQDITK